MNTCSVKTKINNIFVAILFLPILSGCAEYVALELAVAAMNSATETSSETGGYNETEKNYSNEELCWKATKTIGGKRVWNQVNFNAQEAVKEAKKRKLSCGVETQRKEKKPSQSNSITDNARSLNNERVCFFATTRSNKNVSSKNTWEKTEKFLPYVKEAKRRGLNCNVTEIQVTKPVAQNQEVEKNEDTKLSKFTDDSICERVVSYSKNSFWTKDPDLIDFVKEAKLRGLDCGSSKTPIDVDKEMTEVSALDNKRICSLASSNGKWNINKVSKKYVNEAKRRGLKCATKKEKKHNQEASQANSPSKEKPSFNTLSKLLKHSVNRLFQIGEIDQNGKIKLERTLRNVERAKYLKVNVSCERAYEQLQPRSCDTVLLELLK